MIIKGECSVPRYSGIGIYGIVNEMDGKVYVGSAKNINLRLRQHMASAKARTEPMKLQNLFDSGDPIKFVVFEKMPDGIILQQLLIAEKDYIRKFNSFHSGYNSSWPCWCSRNSRYLEPIYSAKEVRMPPNFYLRDKDKIKAHAESKGMSLNAYINGLIEKDMNTGKTQ